MLNKAFIVTMCILVSGQLFYNTKVSTMLTETENIVSEKDEAAIDLQNLQPYLENPTLLTEESQKSKDRLSMYMELIPNEDKSSKHIEVVRNISTRYALKAYYVQFERPEEVEYEHQKLIVNIALEGKQPDLLKAIEHLQSFDDHAYEITELELSPSEEGLTMLKASMVTYYSK